MDDEQIARTFFLIFLCASKEIWMLRTGKRRITSGCLESILRSGQPFLLLAFVDATRNHVRNDDARRQAEKNNRPNDIKVWVHRSPFKRMLI